MTPLILLCSRSRWCPWAKDAMQLKAKQAFLQHPESLECTMSISELICLKKLIVPFSYHGQVCYTTQLKSANEWQVSCLLLGSALSKSLWIVISEFRQGCLSHMNSVKWPCSPQVLVAQWKERQPGVQEVMGLNPVRDSDFYFVPRSYHVDQFTFHNSVFFLTRHVGNSFMPF